MFSNLSYFSRFFKHLTERNTFLHVLITLSTKSGKLSAFFCNELIFPLIFSRLLCNSQNLLLLKTFLENKEQKLTVLAIDLLVATLIENYRCVSFSTLKNK